MRGNTVMENHTSPAVNKILVQTDADPVTLFKDVQN